jgi:hypothetical protein
MFYLLGKSHPFMDADTGVNGGSVADSQDPDINTDINAGVNTDEGEGPDGGATDSEENADLASQKVVQTPEQNAAFAQMRRKADQAEREKEKTKRDLEIAKKYGVQYGIFSEEDIAAKFGQSHGINTLEEFESALQQQAAREAGIDPNLINQFVSTHPDVQKAREFMEQMIRQQTQAQLENELRELVEEYPELQLKTLADLQRLPNYDAIIEKAKKGNTLLEAYVLVNRKEISQKAKEQGAQQTIRNINSKSHLGTEKSGIQSQGKEVELSPEELRVWRAIGYTETEAKKRAAKYIKKKQRGD